MLGTLFRTYSFSLLILLIIVFQNLWFSPGRFFAVNELKAMMAYFVLNYEIKAEVEGVKPENVYRATRVDPNLTAKVLVKKRAQA